MRRREIRPVDLPSINNLVEAPDHILVSHHERHLQIQSAAPSLDMGDRALALEQARSPRDLFRRRHPKMVPPNERSV